VDPSRVRKAQEQKSENLSPAKNLWKAGAGIGAMMLRRRRHCTMPMPAKQNDTAGRQGGPDIAVTPAPEPGSRYGVRAVIGVNESHAFFEACSRLRTRQIGAAGAIVRTGQWPPGGQDEARDRL